jgi:hypothetical protein
MKNGNNKETNIEYEKATIAQEYNNTDNTVIKSGLSRLKPNDHIYVWGTVSENDNQKISAIKIFRLPVELFTSNASPSASIEASKSATPIASPKPIATPKSSPKATPKASP